MPTAPLSYYKSYFLFGIIAVHYLRMSCDKLIGKVRCSYSFIIKLIVKIGGRLHFGPYWHRIIMQVDSINIIAVKIFHHDFCPVIVGRAWTAGYSVKSVSRIIAAERLIPFINVGVIFGTHISSAAPVFIADTEVFEFPRLGSAVLLSLLCER